MLAAAVRRLCLAVLCLVLDATSAGDTATAAKSQEELRVPRHERPTRRVNWFVSPLCCVARCISLLTRGVYAQTDGGGWPVGTDGLNLTGWVQTHRGAITGTFPCCSCWRVAPNGTFYSTGRCAGANIASHYGLEVTPTGGFDVSYLINETWVVQPNSLASAVALMEREGWDGLGIDNENYPGNGMPPQLPYHFADLLGNLSTVVAAAGKRLTVDVASTWHGDLVGPTNLPMYARRTAATEAVTYMDSASQASLLSAWHRTSSLRSCATRPLTLLVTSHACMHALCCNRCSEHILLQPNS